jgi:hypothetical protein
VAAETQLRLNDRSTKKHEYPAVLFEQLTYSEVAYYTGTTTYCNFGTGLYCIVVIFATSAERFYSVLNSEQQAKGATLTMDDLEDAMHHKLWRQGGRCQNKHTCCDDVDEIMVLAAFGGTCYNCQEKRGHI